MSASRVFLFSYQCSAINIYKKIIPSNFSPLFLIHLLYFFDYPCRSPVSPDSPADSPVTFSHSLNLFLFINTLVFSA